MLKRNAFSWVSSIKFSVLPLAAAFMMVASSAQAQWVLLEDFQGYTDGDLVVDLTTPNVGAGATWDGIPTQPNQHFFATDPDCAENGVMRIGVSPTPGNNGNAVTRAQINDSANYIAAGDTGTVFYRFRVPVAATGTLDHVVGLTDNPTIGNFNFKSGLRNIGNNDFDIRDGGGYENIIQGLADNTWYNFWMVTTNTNPGTFRCYIQSDDDPTFATQTELIGDDPWDYRINGDTDIINVYFRGAANAGGVAGNDLYFDDIYINSSASDLTKPAGVGVCPTGVVKGDCDMDGDIDFDDIPAFITILQSGMFVGEADCDCSGTVDFSDIPAFIVILQSQ